MEKISNERRVYESLDDKRAYLRIYLENRRKIKFMKQRVKPNAAYTSTNKYT